MDCRPVDKEMVILWKSVLRENLAPVTVNGALAALNGFFKYCDWQDCRARFLKISKNTFFVRKPGSFTKKNIFAW